MKQLKRLETLFEADQGEALPLSGKLADVLAPLRLTTMGQPHAPSIIGNMVSTLDGVVALNSAGHMSGGDISGFNLYDQIMVGTLRALADAVIVGAETFRVESVHVLTPEDIAPDFAAEYRQLRGALGKTGELLNVIVSARGELNLARPPFQQKQIPILVITTNQGLRRLREQSWPAWLQVEAVEGDNTIAAQTIVQTVCRVSPGKLLLVEGGPRLMSAFIAERCLHELFLTLAPQIAGRDNTSERPGIVKGQLFAPQDPRWQRLVSVKRAESHLFLRYALDAANKL